MHHKAFPGPRTFLVSLGLVFWLATLHDFFVGAQSGWGLGRSKMRVGRDSCVGGVVGVWDSQLHVCLSSTENKERQKKIICKI